MKEWTYILPLSGFVIDCSKLCVFWGFCDIGGLLGDVGDLLGDVVDLLGDGGNPRSIAGGSSKMTVAQKCSEAMEIQKYDGRTYSQSNGLTWVGDRDTCLTKKWVRTWPVLWVHYNEEKNSFWANNSSWYIGLGHPMRVSLSVACSRTLVWSPFA